MSTATLDRQILAEQESNAAMRARIGRRPDAPLLVERSDRRLEDLLRKRRSITTTPKRGRK